MLPTFILHASLHHAPHPHLSCGAHAGYNPYAVAARLRELEEEVKALRLEISPIYSTLILKYSNYTKPQQDM